MMLFQVTYERFLEEIRIEKVQPGDKNQLECEDLGGGFAYYLTSLDRRIGFVFVVKKDELTDAQKLQLGPISKQSKRIRESVELTSISDSLKKIEQNLKSPATVVPAVSSHIPDNLKMNLVKNPNRRIDD